MDDGVQRLIHIMRDGIERAAQTSDMLMRIQRIGIQCISYPEGPGQLLGHLPGVLCVEIEIEEVEGFVRRGRESLGRRGCDSINILRQGSVGNGRDRSLPEVIVVQAKYARVGSKPKFVRAMTPSEVVVDKIGRRVFPEPMCIKSLIFSSALTVCSSSLMDCSSSLLVSNSSAVQRYSSLMDCSSSLAARRSSLAASNSSRLALRCERVSSSSSFRSRIAVSEALSRSETLCWLLPSQSDRLR